MSHPFPEERRALLLGILNGVLVLCSIGALAILVVLVGWPLPASAHVHLHTASYCVLGIFVFQELFRVLLQPRPLAYIRSHKLETLLAGIVVMEVLFGRLLYRWLDDQLDFDLSAGTLALFYLAASQLTLFALVGLRALRNNRLLSHRRITPGMVFMLSFALLITLGTLLLQTPRATHHGISWVDALFTSTSAACVTGLIVVNPAVEFTRHGQYILLGLIQLGGLGIMTLTYFFAYFLAGGVSLRNRIALQDLLSEDNLGQVGIVLGIIIGFTLTCEAIGASAIYCLLDAQSQGISPEDRLFFSVFHAVSAFCNAGFSTLSDGLVNPALHGQDGVLIVIMLLIVAGGIGFPVAKNCWQVCIASVRKKIGLRTAVPPRLSTNSRVVLTTTLLLLVGGTLGIYATEFLFGNGDPAGRNPWFVSVFNAVTARTAGFSITSGQLFTPATAIFIMFLMFVGGSPSSTAGGIKTSTLAVAFLSLRRVMLGRTEIEAFGRRLNDTLANRALSIILVTVAFVTCITIVLCMLHPELPAADLGFEAISAISTAGFTRGITHKLSDPAKLVLALTMFVGRVGVLTCLLAFITRREPTGYQLPETTVVIS